MINAKPVQKLAEAVVLRAVDDWRALSNKKPPVPPDVSFEEIEDFFNGSWAEMLCGRVNPKYILRKLKTESKNAEKETTDGVGL